MPLVIALVPLKCLSRHLQFPHRVPFSKVKNVLQSALALSKNEAYRPAMLLLTRPALLTQPQIWRLPCKQRMVIASAEFSGKQGNEIVPDSFCRTG